MLPLVGAACGVVGVLYPIVMSVQVLAHWLYRVEPGSGSSEGVGGAGTGPTTSSPLSPASSQTALLLAYWVVRALCVETWPLRILVAYVPDEIRLVGIMWLLSPLTRGGLQVVKDILAPARQRIVPRAVLLTCGIITYVLSCPWVLDSARMVERCVRVATRWAAALVLPEDARSTAQEFSRAAGVVSRRFTHMFRLALPALRSCVRAITDALEAVDGDGGADGGGGGRGGRGGASRPKRGPAAKKDGSGNGSSVDAGVDPSIAPPDGKDE
jgi:hypothetical protein